MRSPTRSRCRSNWLARDGRAGRAYDAAPRCSIFARASPPPPLRLDEADLALILASQAWRDLGSSLDCVPNRHPEAGEDESNRWHRLEKSWSQRLRTFLTASAAGSLDQLAALQRLRRMHEVSIRVNLSRVHPSWCVRALKEESPAVRRVVAASAPEPLRSAIRTGLSLDEDDLAGDRPANPEVLSWALVLWTERLVGGDPARSDDPPAISVLTRLSPRRGYEICRLAGEIKGLTWSPESGSRAAKRGSIAAHERDPEFAGGGRSSISRTGFARHSVEVPGQGACSASRRQDWHLDRGPTAGQLRAVSPAVGVAAVAVSDRQANPVALARAGGLLGFLARGRA